MHLSDFDYALPPELIAQHPAPARTASRLLHVDGRTGAMADRDFADIVALVDAGDVLVVNDTRVIKARLHGRKDSGGEVEVLVERLLDSRRALAQVRASKPPKAGRRLVRSDRAIFTGYLKHRELRHLFPCCDAAVFPSLVKEAGPLVFLCSDAASHVCGEILIVDAGFTGSGVTGAYETAAMAVEFMETM